ncbi:MAG: Hsp33 family molecular chaperone HslO [Gammaproteobacteria bacterium]|nr:Hsp33 family molecular chaperone HslO [Gammaproteobacteria bacterium]
MKKQDILQRFLFENAPIRGELVHLNDSFQTIIKQHDYPPVIQRLLGEALVLASLLSAIIKFEGRLTLQFQGRGKLKLLMAQCNNDFHLRGLVQWDGELTQDELIEDFQKGTLAILMDPDASGRRYQGIVEWRGSSLTESIEGYFENSEQLLTRIWIAIDEHSAAGILLQILPREGGIRLESPTAPDRDWEHIVILTDTIKSDELLTLDNKTILHRLYVEEDVRLFEAEPVIFRCTCSVQRGESAILLLTREEAEEELRDKQKLVVVCEFCNKEYVFDRIDVEKIFRKGGTPPTSTKIH